MNPDHLRDYLSRSGDDKLSDGNIEYADHGFMVWRVTNDKFVMVNVYGDGRYWDEWATNKAKELGLKTVMFATKRKPELFIRRSNYDYSVFCCVLERSV